MKVRPVSHNMHYGQQSTGLQTPGCAPSSMSTSGSAYRVGTKEEKRVELRNSDGGNPELAMTKT